MKPKQDQIFSCQGQGDNSELIATFLPEKADAAISDGAVGNPCQLQILQRAPIQPMATGTEVTLCQSWPTQHSKYPAIIVSCCTTDGQAIQCCGHGMLAATHSWLRRLQCDELSVTMNNSQIMGWHEQANTWLRFSRLPTKCLPVPDWVAEVFPQQQQPIAAASCGDEHGYLILQWPDKFTLKQLTRPLDCLSELSQRALICTSAHPCVGPDAVQLRYFAPQYGVDEDPATGSAVRVLAEYWSHRFTSLTAQQCSHQGGLLLARWTPKHIDVGGRCKILETTTKND